MQERDLNAVSDSNPRLTRRRFLQLLATTLLTARCVGNNPNELSIQPDLITSEPPPYRRQLIPPMIKGVSLPSWNKGEYQLPTAVKSLQEILSVDANFVSIVPTQSQANIRATDIKPSDQTATDEDLRFIINKSHQAGLKVMLKPHVILKDESDGWHGEIGKSFTEKAWENWFSSYRQMITNYAQIAEETGVELFIVGNEFFYSATNRPNDWVTTIDQIRTKYRGPLTYAAHPYDFASLTWWDKLDMLGLDPYYGLTTKLNPTLNDLRAGWTKIAGIIDPIVKKWGKKIVFPEIGYYSSEGTGKDPWKYAAITDPAFPPNEQQQADCTKALYETMGPKSYWLGMFWWAKDIDPKPGTALATKGYSYDNKIVQNIISAFNSRH